MKRKWVRVIPAGFIFIVTIACGSEQQSTQTQQSYKDTKSIVLDVLKSEDAQKVVQEALNKNRDKTAQLLSTHEGQQMQMAVKEVLIDPNNYKMIQQTMVDPKFAGEFAKAISKENKQLHRDLLKDPEYQKSLVEAMNTPDFDQIMFTLMKQPKYRQQMMNVVMDSMSNPIFKLQIMQMVTKVVEQGTRPSEEKAAQQQTEGKGGQKSKQEGGDQTSKKSEDSSSGESKDKSQDQSSDSKKKKQDGSDDESSS